ncbi:hypothetical protein [Rudaeicoccus suwonensis]|uniref:hypothetical protein n=1 Tax=Rudaeicoccus suwonensis TaxID=657409 RepID=UPI0011A4384A|nr:hypothetical protein [Rudaeicoccus suwonensis]
MNRRTLAKGAAWAAPVLVLSSQAPVFAASPVPCPAVPTPTGWTMTTSGSPGSTTTGGYGWTSTAPYSFSEVQDAASRKTFTVTTTTSVGVTAGVTYTINTNVTFNYGSNNANTSKPQTCSLVMGGTTIFSYTTGSSPLTTPYSAVPVSGTYQATSTGLVALTFTFAVQAPGSGGNDDVTVTLPTFSNCVAT